MNNKNKKLNDGCIKIFDLLTLLYNDEADYNNVLNIFKDDLNEEQSPNNIQVILNKYINTLKVFGIKLRKVKNKFKMESSLYSVDFTFDDLKSIALLYTVANNFPDKEISAQIRNFIKILTFRMDNECRNILDNLNKNYDFSFFYSNMREQIEQCKQICNEKFVTNILYLKNNKEVKCKCSPKEIIYDAKKVYLRAYDVTKRENIDIPLANILSIAKLPQRANSTELTTTVVYKLKNRLAKTYKIKENEYSDGYDENGNLIIINKNEPLELLLKRLMRYSFNCEIISPKSLRNEMIALISQTLNNYSDDTDETE